MKKIIFCVSMCLLNLPAFALDYNDFPPDLQKTLDQRNATLTSKEGMCVAGRLRTNDGTQFKGGGDVKVNLYGGFDIPLRVYDGGWFIMEPVLPANYNRGYGTKIMLRSFEYDPIDANITLLQGKITYAEFVMHATPAENLASVSGMVLNDKNEPVEGVYVSLSFPFSCHAYDGRGATEPRLEMTTDKDGRYSFERLSISNFSITAFKKVTRIIMFILHLLRARRRKLT